MRSIAILLALGALCAGCGTYRWTSSVPAGMRTVAVPTFANASDVTELGAVASREILREFQREGTFRVAGRDEAAVEVQGEILEVGGGRGYGGRSIGMRLAEYRVSARVKVSVIDRRSGRVLVDGRVYEPTATFAAGDDLLTARRDASGRLAEDLARQVVDDVLGCQW